MDTARTPYIVHQCSNCPGDTEYYCKSCPCDLCPQCKASHVKDLKTMDHDVVTRREKINYMPTQEICLRHPSNKYKKYCELCQVPMCDSCSEDHSLTFRGFRQFPSSLFRKKKHTILSLKEAYRTKLQQNRGIINTIRSDALFERPVLLTGTKADFKTCYTKFSFYQSEIIKKAKTLMYLINFVLYDLLNNVLCDFDFKHRCLRQKIEMNRYIVNLQRYVHIYEQSEFEFSPLHFLSSIKTPCLPQIHLTFHNSQLSMTESLNKEDVMESLTIQITERGNRRVEIESLLKLMSVAEFHQSLTLKGVRRCDHIVCVTSDQVWVSDRNKLILTNTTGVALHQVEDSCSHSYRGSYTVNSERELIYIDRNYNVNKLSKDMKTTTTIIQRTDSTWRPRCMCWSLSTGDLLVAMFKYRAGKVTRFNHNRQLTQTIQHDGTGLQLYCDPRYITENNNGDVVVSDWLSAVVVTDRGGRHRFSYTGHPSGSGLWSRGICTDALSHILVCDDRTNAVHIIDKDGQFLSHLLKKTQETGAPQSLSYDVNTHLLWVRTGDSKKLYVYRYITRQDTLQDEHTNDAVIGIPCPAQRLLKNEDSLDTDRLNASVPI